MNYDDERSNYVAGTKILIISIIIAFFLATCTAVTYGQKAQISVGFDVRNGTLGSAPTNDKAKLDLLLGLKYIAKNNLTFGTNYESFKAIGFTKFGLYSGYNFVFGRWQITPAIEGCSITRIGTETVYPLYYKDGELIEDLSNPLQSPHREYYLALGLNADFDYFITERIGIGIHSNLLHREDLKAMYNDDKWILSNYLKLIYKL